MSDFTYRIRFKINPTGKINIESNFYEIVLADHDVPARLASHENKPVSESHDIVFMSSGWKSEDEARTYGEKSLNALIVAFAGLGIGANFGTRLVEGGRFTLAGLEWARRTFQVQDSLLNDTHGLMVYESNPKQRFVGGSNPSIIEQIPLKKFDKVLNVAFNKNIELEDNKVLALEVFHSSSFLTNPDAKFVLLFISLEALIPTIKRSESVIPFVEKLIQLTKNESFEETEKQSILGSLEWLKYKSIRQAGKEFLADVLRSKLYMSITAPDFFLHCYNMRNNIVHGNPPLPSRDEVSSTAANLQKLVSDLVSVLILGDQTNEQ